MIKHGTVEVVPTGFVTGVREAMIKDNQFINPGCEVATGIQARSFVGKPSAYVTSTRITPEGTNYPELLAHALSPAGIEAAARAMCVAEGIDPEHVCIGVGRIVPEGEKWPAWKVRMGRADAAVRAALGVWGVE
jgi:hypothetical protein